MASTTDTATPLSPLLDRGLCRPAVEQMSRQWDIPYDKAHDRIREGFPAAPDERVRFPEEVPEWVLAGNR